MLNDYLVAYATKYLMGSVAKLKLYYKFNFATEPFEGSIITVSHDRYFLNKLFNTTYLLKNKTLDKFEGNYNYIKEKIL